MKIFRCCFIPTGDYTGPGYCKATFTTASSPTVHAEQLRVAAWSIVINYPKAPSHVKNLSPRTSTLCPDHRPVTGRLIGNGPSSTIKLTESG